VYKFILVALVSLAASSSAIASTLPAGFVETVVATGLTAPTSFEFTPDGRIFVCQQTGALRVVDESGKLLATPFITLTVNSSGERGLLGIALDPNFASNNFVYLYYTATTPAIHNRISRFTANGNVVVPGSELVLLDLDNLGATNHNGGALHFGPDGKLYLAAGENANGANAQNLTNLLGKIIRINSNGTIPNDNPFFNDQTGIRKEIWAYGFRNPWRFTFQPGTGAMFIGDVGEGTWEEVDIGVSGGNFGWPGMEGNHCTGNGSCTGIADIFEYNHNGSGAAITGGDFYSGGTFPAAYANAYFYGDSVDSILRYLVLNGSNAVISDNAFGTGVNGPVEIRYHENAMWYTAINSGQLRRITFTSRAAIAGDWNGDLVSTPGIYTRSTGTFALRNSNDPGSADFFFNFGSANLSFVPVNGDWDGNGTVTPGLYDPATGNFFLRNSNSPGNADITFSFGAGGVGLVPIIGDWNGDGVDTIGIYNPANGAFFLRNSNSAGSADMTFTFGSGGVNVIPIAGDWDGNLMTSIGLYNQATSTFFLRNSNSSGGADLAFTFGASGRAMYPVVANWDSLGGDSIALYDLPTGAFFLRNTNSAGPADLMFNFGPAGP
jgi:glucose/arabinose dehydrogenase